MNLTDNNRVPSLQKHITAIAVIQIAFGILGILIGLIVFVLTAGSGLLGDSSDNLVLLIGIGAAVYLFFLLLSIPEIVCGYGLLRRKSWSRILGLVLAALKWFEIPFGTIFGIYAFYILLNDKTSQLFEQS